MNEVFVTDVSPIRENKPNTVIGVGDEAFEVVPRSRRDGGLVRFSDGKESVVLYVRALGKMRQNESTRNRY